MLINNTQENKQLGDISGLLCIDCWEMDSPEANDYYQTLEKNIDFNQFDSILVANYELALNSNDLCQYNVLEVYSWSDYEPKMLLPVMKEARQRKTSHYLQKHLKSHSFLILNAESFQHHVTTYVPHIKNWLIIGGSWGICTHYRPLGFDTLKTLPYNFYIAPWTMFNYVNNGINDDSLSWVDQNNGLYRLSNPSDQKTLKDNAPR